MKKKRILLGALLLAAAALALALELDLSLEESGGEWDAADGWGDEEDWGER